METAFSLVRHWRAPRSPATIVGVESGPKIRALTYKAKSIQRKRWGHRQWYTTVEINKISPKPAKAAKVAKAAEAVEA